MRVTVITCDRCRTVVEKATDQMLSMDFRVGGSCIKSYPITPKYKDICDKCLEAIQIRLIKILDEQIY